MSSNNVPKWVQDKFNSIDDNIKGLRESYKILNDHSSQMQRDTDKVANDVDWIKRFFWIIATTSTGALVTGLINLISKQ